MEDGSKASWALRESWSFNLTNKFGTTYKVYPFNDAEIGYLMKLDKSTKMDIEVFDRLFELNIVTYLNGDVFLTDLGEQLVNSEKWTGRAAIVVNESGEVKVRKTLIIDLYAKGGGECYLCHREMDLIKNVGGSLATIEHVVAKANGGKDDISNMKAACSRCNSKKRDDELWKFLHDVNKDRICTFITKYVEKQTDSKINWTTDLRKAISLISNHDYLITNVDGEHRVTISLRLPEKYANCYILKSLKGSVTVTSDKPLPLVIVAAFMEFVSKHDGTLIASGDYNVSLIGNKYVGYKTERSSHEDT